MLDPHAPRKVVDISSAGRAGGITTIMMLVNIVIGFVFQSFVAAKIGLSPLADVFQGTWAVVTFGATVQLTMVTSLLVPHCQHVDNGILAMSRTRQPIALGFIATGLQLVIALLFSTGDSLILLIASAPSHLFVAAASVPLARAYIGRRFVTAGAGAIANGIALLATALVGASVMGPVVLGVGLSLGYLAQWLVTVVGTRGAVPLTGTARISAALFMGVTAFTVVSKLQPVLERAISLSIAEGATSALGFGQKIATGLLMLGTFGLALTTNAALSRHVSAEHWQEAGDLLSKTAVASFALTSAVAAVALPLSFPSVVVLFQRGEFTHADSQVVADIVVAQIPWAITAALTGVFTFLLYALRWYARVLAVSAAGLAGTLGVSTALAGSVPMLAVAIGSSAGSTLALVATLVLVRRTPICKYFWAGVKNHRALGKKAAFLIGWSIAMYFALFTFGATHEFWPGIFSGTLTIAMVALHVGSSRQTRLQLREVLGAEV